MNTDIPRLRMFAGPNGSGKSTIKSVIPAELVGAYVNADDLEKEIRATGCIDLVFGLHASQEDVYRFFQESPSFSAPISPPPSR